MANLQIKKATKKKVKLKIGISGASGFGKTFSALQLAYGITGDWSKILVIDTENESASLYEDLGGDNTFNVIDLSAPYTPERYIEAIEMGEKAGMEVIICDSISHEWDGEGGCLEIAEQITEASRSKNSYTSWAKVSPRHKKFINKILQTRCHFITTTRRKQEYEMVFNDRTKRNEIQKLGTKEITREGFEYELTLNFEIVNDKHYAKASKDRTGLFMDKPEFVIDPFTGQELIEWANKGVDEKKYLIESISNAKSREELLTIWNNNKPYQSDSGVFEVFKKMGEKYPSEQTKQI